MFYQAVHTGKGGDFAVDGILIIINDTPVTTLTQAKELISAQKRFTCLLYTSPSPRDRG